MDSVEERAIAERCMEVFESEWRGRNPKGKIRRMEQNFFSPVEISVGISLDKFGVQKEHAVSRRIVDAHRIVKEYHEEMPTKSVYVDVGIEQLEYEHINVLRRKGRYIHYEDNETHKGVPLRDLLKRVIRLKVKDTLIRGLSVFADQHIPAGTVVMEYVGEIYRLDEVPLTADKAYLFKAENGWVIDAKDCGNLSRYVNHICNKRSRFCNIESIAVEYKGSDPELKGLYRIIYVATRNIEPEQELLLKYNMPNSFRCRCPLCLAPRRFFEHVEKTNKKF